MSAFTFPGVYIQELSSGVHTITGVATSIAAFVGWAPKGPNTEAVLVQSFSDFQRQFGGFDSRSYLGYAVNQFFSNGGQQAFIVRIAGADAAAATATVSGLTLWATGPGVWANGLKIVLTIPSGSTTTFNLQVQDPSTTPATTLETYLNLTAASAVAVIDNSSQFITFVDPTTGLPPASITLPAAGSGTLGSGADEALIPQPKDGINGTGSFETALNLSGTISGTAPLTGIHLLDSVEIFNLLCVPGETDEATISTVSEYCNTQRAFYIVDSPRIATVANLGTGPVGAAVAPLSGNSLDHGAYYFPWVQAPDPLANNSPRLFPPCGFVAGIYAFTDANRGVWKAPAGIDASLTGVTGLQYNLTDAQNGILNPQAINCLRQFRVYGDVVWGARTLQGNDQAGSQWKYVPIRRLALFLESSLYDGTQWVVFEPNDETLWGQIRLNVGSFMQGLFLQGAFQGTTPQQAYFVKCDAENNPQSSIDQGIVYILVGFAPLYPAEFVVIQIQQMAGQLQS
jgi:hypothetical protein